MRTLPIREQVPRGLEESVFCEHLTGRDYGTPWHFHPELELVLVRKSQGFRVVGDNITTLAAGDLVFVGANLPHLWFQEKNAGNIDAIVVQFPDEFSGRELAVSHYFKPVRKLFEKAQRGLHITGRARDSVSARMDQILMARPLRRVAELLSILDELAHSDEITPLSSPGFTPQLSLEDEARLNRVMQFLHDHLREAIHREQVAAIAALSPSAFSRFFKSRTGRTFPEYLNELRLGRAAQLLSMTDQRVADIAADCGFGNLSHFNNLFLRWKGLTPRQFRNRIVSSC